jgi:hypothetical protein
MFRQLHDPYWVGMSEMFIGGVDYVEGKFEAADTRLGAALSIFHRRGNVMGTAWVLYAFADAARRRGHPGRALRLVGASDALRKGVEMPGLAIATMGDPAERARADLHEAAAEEAYRAGLAMGLEQAVAYALNQEA